MEGNENSFLPISENGRAEIVFEILQSDLRDKIAAKVKGKYPVLIGEDEAKYLVNLIRKKAEVMVLSDINKK